MDQNRTGNVLLKRQHYLNITSFSIIEYKKKEASVSIKEKPGQLPLIFMDMTGDDAGKAAWTPGIREEQPHHGYHDGENR